MAPRLWIDVEDLFEYRLQFSRPSGIQRLAFEIYAKLQERYGSTGLVCFLRHDPARNGFRSVAWSEVAALFGDLLGDSHTRPAPGPRLAAPVRAKMRRLGRELVRRMPSTLRMQVTDVLLTQARAFRAWATLLAALFRSMMRIGPRIRNWAARSRVATGNVTSEPADSYADLVAPGDVLLVLGAFWSHPNYYAGLIEAERKKHGLRFGLLVYDLIPVRRPEWCDRGFVELFRDWFANIFPLCDVLFAISQATADDATAYAREQGIILPSQVVTIPIGSAFGPVASVPPAARNKALPPAGTYALMVSTIEARKNHLLLFRVWRRMLEEMPRDQVPTLVFAGRIGWLVGDLMRQIANTDNLGGKLIIIESPSDTDLVSLYQGCLFTLFPSFYEGWGLPVTESLTLGKPCLIADRTSLPEAGAGFCRSFDPDNLNEAYTAIRGVVEDRAGLARWEAEIRRDFRPVPWSATVEALLAGLGHPLAEGVRNNAATQPARRQAMAILDSPVAGSD